MNINKPQLIAINVLVNKLNISKDNKAIMVEGLTNGRATSTKDLTFEEASDFIKHLKSLDPEEAKAEKMRKSIIAMAHEMKWQKPNGKADMDRINGWCLKYGGKNKTLNQYYYNELPLLVTAFKKVYFSFLKKV